MMYEASKKYEEVSATKYLIILGIIIVFVSLLIIFFIQTAEPIPTTTTVATTTIRTATTVIAPSLCGNDVVDPGENCWDCPKDVSCSGGEYCSQESKECLSAICGNDECEPGESRTNCCDDCGCDASFEICDSTTHECYVPDADISDERVEELIRSYFENQNKTVEWIEVGGSTVYNNVPAKVAAVNLTGEARVRPHAMIVTVDEEVLEIEMF